MSHTRGIGTDTERHRTKDKATQEQGQRNIDPEAMENSDAANL